MSGESPPPKKNPNKHFTVASTLNFEVKMVTPNSPLG